MEITYSPNLLLSSIMSVVVILVVVAILLLGLYQFGTFTRNNEIPIKFDINALRSEIVIVTAHWKENLDWLKESIWKVVVCDKEGADPTSLPIEQKCLCPNVGRESSSYLKYIVTHYDTLAPFTAFIHGHETAWHQRVNVKGPFKSTLLNAIFAVDTEKYEFVTLNDCWIDDWKKDNHNFNMEYMHMIWDENFRPWLKIPAPNHLRSDCCSTFMVSKRLIQQIPKEAYEHWLNMFIDTKQNQYIFALGYCFEYLWHVIFGQDPVRTPISFKTYCIGNC